MICAYCGREIKGDNYITSWLEITSYHKDGTPCGTLGEAIHFCSKGCRDAFKMRGYISIKDGYIRIAYLDHDRIPVIEKILDEVVWIPDIYIEKRLIGDID